MLARVRADGTVRVHPSLGLRVPGNVIIRLNSGKPSELIVLYSGAAARASNELPDKSIPRQFIIMSHSVCAMGW